MSQIPYTCPKIGTTESLLRVHVLVVDSLRLTDWRTQISGKKRE